MNLLDVLYVPLAVITSPWWALKKRSGWGERFGKIAPPHIPTNTQRPQGAGRILLHAVSVGEVSALRYLIPLLTKDAEVVLSVSTDTGLARAKDLFGGSCAVVRYPLDFSWSVSRFLDAVKPDVVGLVELEVWPNFVGACVKRGIPVSIINGRLSARSFKGYSRIRRFFSPTLKKLTWAAVQDQEYAQRFQALGVNPEKVLITGSMKWDAVEIQGAGNGGVASQADQKVAKAKQIAAEMGIDLTKPLIVAGSTGPGEEALLHQACPVGVQLVCAPRKPQRFDEAAAALPLCTRRSSKQPARPGQVRFLLDSIGELSAVYSLADVVVVGRSFLGLYGSDPIEPIALGKATVIGEYVSDFASIVNAFVEAGGIVQTNASGLQDVLQKLMASEQTRTQVASRGTAVIEKSKGASQRHRELLIKELGNSRKSGKANSTPRSNQKS